MAAVDKSTTNPELHFFNNCFGDGLDQGMYISNMHCYCSFGRNFRVNISSFFCYTELVWKVARYTSASPLFFGEFENYVDGGVLANNPCDCGLTAIQNFYRLQGDQLRISIVVSIGTGVYPAQELGQIDAQEFLFFGMHWFHLSKLKEKARNLITLLANAVSIYTVLRSELIVVFL